MRNELLKFIALFTYYVKTLRLRAREFLLIKLKKDHRRYKIVELQDHLKTSPRVAIVAIYPRNGLLNSVKRLNQALKEQGYSILIVLNETKNADKFIEQLSSTCSILVRPNIGRDFGAYQSGFIFLRKFREVELLKSLVLANDSVYYHKKSGSFIKSTLNKESDWSTFFVNFQFQIHAQSFFLQFGEAVLKLPEFSRFWQSYYPTSIRHRVINSGEMKLSKMLLRESIIPEYSVNPESVLNKVADIKLSQEERLAIWSPSNIPAYELGSLSKQDDITQIASIFDRHNPTHHLGLLSARILGSPIKLDLFSTGLATRMGYSTTLYKLGADEIEMRDIMNLILPKGSVASVQGIHRLWQKFGLYA